MTPADGVPAHSGMKSAAGCAMSTSPSSWAMPTSVDVIDFVTENASAGTSAAPPPK